MWCGLATAFFATTQAIDVRRQREGESEREGWRSSKVGVPPEVPRGGATQGDVRCEKVRNIISILVE
jgi:hypothetical protein